MWADHAASGKFFKSIKHMKIPLPFPFPFLVKGTPLPSCFPPSLSPSSPHSPAAFSTVQGREAPGKARLSKGWAQQERGQLESSFPDLTWYQHLSFPAAILCIPR